jgi:hypothetical protein
MNGKNGKGVFKPIPFIPFMPAVFHEEGLPVLCGCSE